MTENLPDTNVGNIEYIRRWDAKNIRFSGGINHDGFLYVPYKELVDGIKTLPSADVVQVAHSEWIYHMSFGVCKKCGYEYEWKGTDAKNYCPNCGAKMDA